MPSVLSARQCNKESSRLHQLHSEVALDFAKDKAIQPAICLSVLITSPPLLVPAPARRRKPCRRRRMRDRGVKRGTRPERLQLRDCTCNKNRRGSLTGGPKLRPSRHRERLLRSDTLLVTTAESRGRRPGPAYLKPGVRATRSVTLTAQ